MAERENSENPNRSRDQIIKTLKTLGRVGLYLIDSLAVGLYMGGKARFGARNMRDAEDDAAKTFGPEISKELGLRRKKISLNHRNK